MTISNPARGLVRRLGLAAVAILALSVASQQRAEAVSLASPGTAPSAKHATDGLTTEVRGGHGGGGGFKGGGTAFHGGSFRAAPAFGGGGYRAFHSGGNRHANYRHHFHRRFYYAPSYYAYPHDCRVIWTDYGPRRICHRPWHRDDYWRGYHFGVPYGFPFGYW
jgi:hypothetical protein